MKGSNRSALRDVGRASLQSKSLPDSEEHELDSLSLLDSGADRGGAAASGQVVSGRQGSRGL